LVLVMALVSHSVWANRLGGGGSVGKQSGQVERTATATSTGSTAPSPTSSTANAAPKKPWAALLGGLAAGLGLAGLASLLGLDAAVAHLLLMGLLALVILGIVWAVIWGVRQRHRFTSTTAGGTAAASGLAYQGGVGTPMAPITPHEYSPQNVGNDASARPWERNTTNFESSRYSEIIKPVGTGSLMGAGTSGGGWGVPVGFDADGFLSTSKTNFMALQAAWDQANIPRLRAMMTDDMLTQIKTQLAEREREKPGSVNVTEVVMLEARLLGIEESEHDHMASVEFSGLIREDPSAGPSPFREVWNITRQKMGAGGWLVAGVQALQ
jgi:predicted lipid-binding transport protein (Tim44 family)